MSNDNKATGHNLDTSEGARAYVAQFFANELRRHDFRTYITTRLAADFACALAKHLARQPSPTDTGIPTSPSPAGQGKIDVAELAQAIRQVDGRHLLGAGALAEAILAELPHLAARQPVAEKHPDNLAVDAFAAAMKHKMAAARAKGRGGWEDPAQCSADDLSRMLRDHVEKGDPRDVGNFCMMLHQRGEAIAAQPAQSVDPADPWRGLYGPALMPELDGVNLYHVAHPDLPSWPKDEDEERGIGPLVTAQGFAMAVVLGEYPEDDGGDVDYCAWLASWTPDSPAGAEWRLVCIQDTEDGPAAFFVRPLALIDSQTVGK